MERRGLPGVGVKRENDWLKGLRIFGIVFMLCLMGSEAFATSLAVGAEYINAGEPKDIYAMPDFSSDILSSLAVGEPCEILFIQEDWLEIAYYDSTLGRQTGWIKSDRIEKAPADYPGGPPADSAQQPADVRTSGMTAVQFNKDFGTAIVSTPNGLRLHMRLLPWETSDSMGLYYNGVKVVCHSDPGAEWVTVSVEGHRGYMKSQYLYRGNDPGSVISTIPTALVVNPTPTSWLNMRDEPTMAGQVVGRLYNGDKVSVLGGTEEWCHVKTGNLAGFVMARYLKINGSQPGQPQNGLRHYWANQDSDNYTAAASLTETSKNTFDARVALQYKNMVIHIVDRFQLYINDKFEGNVPAYWTDENQWTVPTDFRVKVIYHQPIASVYLVPVMDNGEELTTDAIYLSLTGGGNDGNQNGGGKDSTGYILCESLSVRASASGTAAVVQKLGYGTTVRVLQKSGAWYNIKYNGKRG